MESIEVDAVGDFWENVEGVLSFPSWESANVRKLAVNPLLVIGHLMIKHYQ